MANDDAIKVAKDYKPSDFKFRPAADIYADARKSIADKYNSFISHPLVQAAQEYPLETAQAVGEAGWEGAKQLPGMAANAAQYVYENPSAAAGKAVEFGAGMSTNPVAMFLWGPGGFLDPTPANAGEDERNNELAQRHMMAQEAQMMRDQNYAGAYAKGGSVYPLRHHDDWEEAHDYEKTGGKLSYMSPDEYLSKVKPLNMDHDDKHLIHHFKKQIEKGEKLDPVAIYPDAHPNGRHRAHAAKKLGIKKIPVVTWPKKHDGGAIAKRALMVVSKKA